MSSRRLDIFTDQLELSRLTTSRRAPQNPSTFILVLRSSSRQIRRTLQTRRIEDECQTTASPTMGECEWVRFRRKEGFGRSEESGGEPGRDQIG